jgi:hypothetical protein
MSASRVIGHIPFARVGHAATSIWNGINRLGLVAPWCDPGPRHHDHQFSEMGHGNTSCDPHLHHNHGATNAPLPHA